MRRAAGALAATAGAALALPAAAGGVPPGGPAENPGEPPAAAAIAVDAVPAHGIVRFTGTGFLTGDGAPQRVYLKLDDRGDDGIGPYVADAAGRLRGLLWLGAPGVTATAAGDHWLRFLAGPSGAFPDNGPARSLKASFTVAPATVELARTGIATGPRRATLALRAPEGAPTGGRVRIRMAGSAATLASGRYAVTGSQALRVPLTAAGRRAVRHGGAVAVRVSFTPQADGARTMVDATLEPTR